MAIEVLETPARLLRKIGIEADSAGLVVATAPPGLHPLHEEPLHADTQQLFPTCEQWRHGFLQLLAIPGFNQSLSLFLASSRRHSQEQPAVEEPAAQEPAAHESAQQPARQPDPGAPAMPWGQSQGNVYEPPPAPSNPFAAAGGPPVPPVPPAAPPYDDHDGHTVAGGWDPNQFARQQPGIPGQPPAPSVTAPAVARLVFSSGETVDVDRAVLVGRAPEARRFTSTDQPRLVTVPSPHQEISSTHVEVRPGSGADHGSAVVTDLGSTNGTVLTQPGLDEEELQPGMAVQLLPGAVIDLGDGVTIRVTNL